MNERFTCVTEKKMEGQQQLIRDTVKKMYEVAVPLKKFYASPQRLKHQDVYLEIESGLLLDEGQSVGDIVDVLYDYGAKIFSFLRGGRDNSDLSEISLEALEFERSRHLYEDATHVDVRILVNSRTTILLIRFITLGVYHAPHVA